MLAAMASKFLLQRSKTDFLVLAALQQLRSLEELKYFKVDDSFVELADAACKLGIVLFNSTMFLINHVNGICKSSYLYIHTELGIVSPSLQGCLWQAHSFQVAFITVGITKSKRTVWLEPWLKDCYTTIF